MEQKYILQTQQESTPKSLKNQLIEQKNSLEARIKALEDKENRDLLMGSLQKLNDISESLIPLQESLNIVWKRTQQMDEEMKEVIKRLS